MTRVLHELTSKIIRVLNYFTEVEVVAARDLEEIRLLTINIPPTRRGDTIRVPLWLADELIRNGLATVNFEDELVWLSRVHWRERVQLPKGTLSLSTIPKDFYARCLKLLSFISTTRPQDSRVNQLKEFYKDVVDRRTHIIFQLSFIGKMDLELKEKLTKEEEVLLSEVKKILVTWFKEVYRNYGGS